VTGGWRRHNEELHNLFCSPVVKEGEVGWACSTHGEYEKCFQIFGWKT
jgi:hypothetical protein